MSEEKSEFGKGFTYCIGLFLMHSERRIPEYDIIKDYGLWFNEAADHLIELEIPEDLNEAFKERIRIFRDKCISFRCDLDPTDGDFDYALKTAKSILLEYDKYLNIDVCKGEYE